MGRRLRIVRVSGQGFLSLLKDGFQVEVVDGIPPSAELRGGQYNQSLDQFEVLVEHHSFDKVPDGAPVPMYDDIIFRVLHSCKEE